MSTSNRKELREWHVYSKTNAKFFNMDRVNPFLDSKFIEEQPSEGFTYEECERFVIHQEDRSDCEILNIKQPKFLLNFQLELFAKETKDKQKEETMSHSQRIYQMQMEATQKSKSKQQFVNDYNAWEKEKSDDSTYTTKSTKEVLAGRPKHEEYGLTESDFGVHERRMIEQI